MNPADERVRVLAMQQDGVVTRQQAVACGLSDSDVNTRLRRAEFVSLWPNVLHVDADVFGEAGWRARARGALLLHGASAALALGSAARALGIAGADTNHDTVHIVLPRGTDRHQVAGIRLHFWQVPHLDLMHADGFRTTSPTRTLADLALVLTRNRAIAAMDSALQQQLVSQDDLQLARAMTAGRKNCRRSDGWWELADPRSESPLETWSRLDCIDGGVPPDDLQWNVFDRHGAFIGRGDMAWTKRRRALVGEADGAQPHSLPEAVFKDRHRGNNFVGAGVDIVRFTWRDARKRGGCAGIVRRALHSN